MRHARCRSAARAVHAAAAQHASLAVHSSASRSPYCTRRSRCGGDACAARCAECATRGAAVQRVQLAVLCTPLPTASVQCTSGRSRFCDDARTARRAAVQRASLADSPCSAAPTALPAAARNVPMEPRRSRCRGAAVPRCSGTRARRSLCRTALRDARRSAVHWVSRAGQRCSRGEHYPTSRTRRASSQTAEGSCHVS